MKLHTPSAHLLRIITGVIATLALGWLLGEWLLVICVALALYLVLETAQLFRLHHWLSNPRKKPPWTHGLWSDIQSGVSQLQQQNRKQKRKLKAMLHEFEQATDAFPDATVIIDKDHNIVWSNPAANRLLGLKVPDDIGQAVVNLIRDPDFTEWLALQAEISSSLDLPSPKDNQLILNATAVRYRKKQTLLIFRDVTAVRQADQVRRDFVANVSHEMRTPLTVLLGYIEVLEQECPEEFRTALGRMLQQGRNMHQLLQDLLDLSRVQNYQPQVHDETIDVASIIDRVAGEAAELSKGRHQISKAVEKCLLLAGNERDIECAFRNLVTNAVSYSPDGGGIQIGWKRSGETLVYEVRDSGIGIPRKDIPRLTERFYRVGTDRSRSAGGSGLGLAIVKHILNAHEAVLEIDSELGSGSAFRCVFPIHRLRNPALPEQVS